MLVKFRGKVSEVKPESIKEWDEMFNLILIGRERNKAINRKLAKIVLEHRKVLTELLNRSEDELLAFSQDNESSLNYAREGMKHVKVAFKLRDK